LCPGESDAACVKLGAEPGCCPVIASELFEYPPGMPFRSFFEDAAPPWHWISQIKVALAGGFETGLPLEVPPGARLEGPLFIHHSVELPPFCSIRGPAWFGAGVEIRPGAIVRGNVIVGPGSVLGNSCEYKNCLLLESVQTPHFSYVGDSVLGNRSHLGAGAILSNLRLDQKPVSVRLQDAKVGSGLRKLGALIGDEAEVGCNAVLNPGSILGKRAVVGPLVSFRGTLEADTMALDKGAVQALPRP